MVVGALTGIFASLLLRLKIRVQDMTMDGILGAIAFPLAFAGALLVPWKNTITYQEPDLVAYTAAILLPVLHELHRFKNRVRSVG